MNTLKTAAATLLIATLAVAQTSFADGRGRGDNDYRQDRHARNDDRGDRGRWDGHGGYRHHYRSHYRHGHDYGHRHGRGHAYGHYNRGWSHGPAVVAPRVVAPQIVLPLPMPPVPVIVLKKHHDARVVLRPF